MTTEEGIKIDFGCGITKPEGYIGIDINPDSAADILHNLEEVPYPFEDNSAIAVRSDHNIEHLEDLDTFLKELHRICKPGAEVTLIFPHYSRSWFSTQHKRAYGLNILRDYQKEFDAISRKFNYKHYTWRSWFWPFCIIIDTLANLSPRFCERVWCYWFGGFDYVTVKAKVKK